LYKPFPPDDEDPDSLRALDLSGFISARDVDHPRWSFLTIGTVFAVVTWLGVGCLRRVHEQVRLLRQRGAPSRSWSSCSPGSGSAPSRCSSEPKLNAEAERSRELRHGEPAETTLRAPPKE